MEAYFGLDIGRYIFIRLKVSNEQTIESRQYINHSDRHFRYVITCYCSPDHHTYTHMNIHACLRHSNFLSFYFDRLLPFGSFFDTYREDNKYCRKFTSLQLLQYAVTMRGIQLFVLVCCFWLKFVTMPCVQRNRPILVHLLDHRALDNSRTIQRVGSLRKIPVLCSNGMRCFFSKKGTYFTLSPIVFELSLLGSICICI